MVRITQELVRKKSEHNELMIGTLEEIALHQEDIERIENIHDWCHDLKILLLQNNLISKIENLFKLKKLEYLNLALNNVEKIENLEQLESLNKLDLTLNFVGELTSIENLKGIYNLEHLTLTGNPCTDYPNYRDYVIATLPQLQTLDSVDITRTDRIKAKQNYNNIRKIIVQKEKEYSITRDQQKIRVQQELERQKEEFEELDEDERSKRFWSQKSEHCPETRIQIAEQHRKSKKIDSVEKKKPKKTRKLFADCGRPYNINELKLEFSFTDDDDLYMLELQVYKYMDTSLMDVDAQPNYVRVTIKKKVFQMAFKDEINISESTTQRSSITGFLLIKMPKLNYKKVLLPGTTLRVNQEKIKIKKSSEIKSKADYKNIIADTKKNDEDLNDEIPELI